MKKILLLISLLSILLVSLSCRPSTFYSPPVVGERYDYSYVLEHSKYQVIFYAGESGIPYFTNNFIKYDSSICLRYGYFVYSPTAFSSGYVWYKGDITLCGIWTLRTLQ